MSALRDAIFSLPSVSAALGEDKDPRRLRLRVIEKARLGRALRGETRSLRQLKIQNGASLAVEVLPAAEELASGDLVLSVRRHLPDLTAFGPAVTVVFPAGTAPQATALRAFLQDYMGVPKDRMIVAKHILDQWSWIILEDRAPPRKKKGKRGGGGGGGGLRDPPYNLRDGDTIGVGDKDLGVKVSEGFETSVDKVRKAAKARKDSGDGKKPQPHKKNTPEAALTIKVGRARASKPE